MRILREHEPGDFAVVRALRKTVARPGGSGAFTCSSGPRNCGACGAGSAPPSGAGYRAGDVPKVPQVFPRREQVLRILRHSPGSGSAPTPATSRAGPTARGAAAPSRASATAETCGSPAAPGPAGSSATSPSRGATASSPGGTAPGAARCEARCVRARRGSAASHSSSPSRGATAGAARRQASSTQTTSPPGASHGRNRGFHRPARRANRS